MQSPISTLHFIVHFWLTYMIDLVGTWAIMNAFGYDLSPALHIAEAKVIELLSGTSSAQFLMVFPHLRGFFFSSISWLYAIL